MPTAPDHLHRNARRQIRRLGEPVSVTAKEQVHDGPHGVEWAETADSPHEIYAIADPGGGSPFRGLFGADTDYDMTFFTTDDHVDIIVDGESVERSSVLAYRDRDWLVEATTWYQQAGILVVDCTAGVEV